MIGRLHGLNYFVKFFASFNQFFLQIIVFYCDCKTKFKFLENCSDIITDQASNICTYIWTQFVFIRQFKQKNLMENETGTEKNKSCLKKRGPIVPSNKFTIKKIVIEYSEYKNKSKNIYFIAYKAVTT